MQDSQAVLKLALLYMLNSVQLQVKLYILSIRIQNVIFGCALSLRIIHVIAVCRVLNANMTRSVIVSIKYYKP